MHKQLFKICLFALSISILTITSAAQAPIPTWYGSFSFGGQTYNYTMIGNDPHSQNMNGTTTIPVTIVPVVFTYFAGGDPKNTQDGVTFDPYEPFCGSVASGVTTVKNSPLFQPYPFYAGPSPFGGGQTSVGTTQYIDAFQRANFWKYIAQYDGTLAEYHVKFNFPMNHSLTKFDTVPGDSFSPVVADSQTPCGPKKMLTVSMSTMIQKIVDRLRSLGALNDTSMLYIFLTRNTQFDLGAAGKLGGTHSGVPGGAAIVLASIADPGIFPGAQQDVYFLAHELAEWVNNPYVHNPTPVCGPVSNLEVGDPVNGTGMSIFINGFTYTLPDLVFVAGFAREAWPPTGPDPAIPVSGGYTFFGVNPNPCH